MLIVIASFLRCALPFVLAVPLNGPAQFDTSPRGTSPPEPADTTPADLPSTRSVPVEDFELQLYAPAWASGPPLARIKEALDRNAVETATALFRRVLADQPQRTLLVTGPERWARGVIIPPNDHRLRRWWKQLGDSASALSPTPRVRATAPILSLMDPRLWHPDLRGTALRSALLAWERGDRQTVRLLDRAGLAPRAVSLWLDSSPETPPAGALTRKSVESETVGSESRAPRLRESGPLAPDSLTAGSKRIETLESNVGSSALDRGLADAAGLRFVSRQHLDALQASPRRPGGTSPQSRPIRRLPMSAIYPIVSDDDFIVSLGSSITAFKREDLRIRWSIEARRNGLLGARPTLPRIADLGVTLGPTSFVARFRTARENAAPVPIDDVSPGDTTSPVLPFESIFIADLSAESGREPQIRCALRPRSVGRAAWTPCGPVSPGRSSLFVPYCRGTTRVELMIAAFDPADGRVVWQRILGARPIEFLSSHDTRNILPETRIHVRSDELHVETGLGWLHRLGEQAGDDRGIISVPVVEPRFANSTSFRLGRIVYRELEDPRPRFPSPPLFFEHEGRSLWITLASDATELVAVDLKSWSIAWTQPVTPTTYVIGVRDAQLILVDPGIRVGDRKVEVRVIELNGRHVRSGYAELSTDGRSNGPLARPLPKESTLLVGVPRLHRDELWIPTISGLEVWELGSEFGPAKNVLEWPRHPVDESLAGGTVFHVSGSRLAMIRRGEVDLAAASTLDLLEVTYPEKPTSR